MDPFDPTKGFSGLGLLAGFKPNALHGLLNSIRPSDDALPPLPPMAFNALTPSSLPPMTLYDALVASPPVMPPFNALADLPPLPAAMTPYMTPPSPMTPYEPAQLPSVAEIIADIVRAEEERAARILPDWRRRHGWINSFGSIDVTSGIDARGRRVDRDAKKGSRYYWHADHVVPLEQNGPDTPSNLRALNDFSNMSEGDRR